METDIKFWSGVGGVFKIQVGVGETIPTPGTSPEDFRKGKVESKPGFEGKDRSWWENDRAGDRSHGGSSWKRWLNKKSKKKGKDRRTVGEDGKVTREIGDEMRYLIDVIKKRLNREEAKKYYEKSIVDMNNIERIPYLKDEMKYISFFKELFELNNKKLAMQINSFCSEDINEFFENEKKDFLDGLKKMKIEDLMLKNEMKIENFDDIIFFIKLSYRDFTAGYDKIVLKYKDINLKISSNSDYTYILDTSHNLDIKIKEIAEKHMIFLKKIEKDCD